jgi:hypothetical protein
LTEEEDEIRKKGLRALRLLMLDTSVQPGMKGWELKRRLGKGYTDALKIATMEADRIGLKIVTVPDEEFPEEIDRARYVLQTKEPLTDPDYGGWLRIEEAAALAILIIELSIRGGVIQRDTSEKVLNKKLPIWRIKQILEKLKRLGYLTEEGALIRKGWRAEVEIDEPGFLRDLVNASST